MTSILRKVSSFNSPSMNKTRSGEGEHLLNISEDNELRISGGSIKPKSDIEPTGKIVSERRSSINIINYNKPKSDQELNTLVSERRSSITVIPERRTSVTDTGNKNGQIESLFLWGIDVMTLPPTLRLTSLAISVFVIYSLYSFLQELIFSFEDYSHGLFMTFCMFLTYSIYSFIGMKWDAQPRSGIPMYQFAIIGSLTVATIALSNLSLQYISYPLQVIFKSSKVIPVMCAGFIFFGKKYSLLEAGSMVLLSVGLALFTLGDMTVNADSEPIGILIISLALVADAMIGNYQESVIKANGKCSLNEMVFFTHIVALAIVFVAAIANNEFFSAIRVCNATPVIYLYMFLMSTTCYLGINSVLVLLQLYGPVVTVTITTTRKFFTILISFMVFPKPFYPIHAFSGFLVFLALFGDMYSKNAPKVKAALQSLKHLIFG